MRDYLKHVDRKKRIKILLVAFFVSCLTTFFFYSQTSFYKVIDNLIYDSYLKYAPRAQSSEKILITDVDDASLAAVGQWPWPRYQLAILVQTILGNSPAGLGVDIIFPEADNASLNTIQKNFNRDFGIDLGFTGLPQGLDDNDGFLNHVLSTGEVVGARYFYFDHANSQTECAPLSIKVIGRTELVTPLEATGELCNIAKLESGFKSTGFINNQFDDDGVLRSMSLLMNYRGDIYPNLSVSLLAKFLGTDSIEIAEDFWGKVIKVGSYTIPINDKGQYLLRYGGPAGTQQTISAIDLLNNSVQLDDIRDKLVLLGVSAVGLGDRHHTVFDYSFPGTETHAVFLANVFNEEFLRIPGWNSSYICFASILAGTIALFVFYRFSPYWAALCCSAWLVLRMLVGFQVFNSAGVYFSSAGPVFMITTMMIQCSLVLYLLENKNAINWHKQLTKVQQATMEAMVAVAESRDPETGGHIQRTKKYARILATSLRNRNVYTDQLTDDYIETLFNSVPLHDVGKVAIPDSILTKPGPLTDEEFEIMKEHCEYGRMIVESASEKLDDKRFLQLAREIASSHHERWNGKGYPLGLKGEEIPLAGRIVAVVDVYDALISRRHYKEPFSHEKSRSIILEGMDGHFDPAILAAFDSVSAEFEAIALEYNDREQISSIS